MFRPSFHLPLRRRWTRVRVVVFSVSMRVVMLRVCGPISGHCPWKISEGVCWNSAAAGICWRTTAFCSSARLETLDWQISCRACWIALNRRTVFIAQTAETQRYSHVSDCLLRSMKGGKRCYFYSKINLSLAYYGRSNTKTQLPDPFP